MIRFPLSSNPIERINALGNIEFFDRYKGSIETEKVYGEAMVKWLYESNGGHFLGHLLCKKPLSYLYGLYQDLPLSKSKVAPFIEKFHINMDEYLPEKGRSQEDPYSSFNKFFIREFKEGVRDFGESSSLAAPAEARYLGHERISPETTYPVKGDFLTAKDLLSSPKWENTFEEGPLLIARLCPVDYHRYHFPDDGKVLDSYPVHGEYHSVNPIALSYKNDIFIRNERFVTILETENFGKIAYIEVGAICVGKIIQSHNLKDDFKRGQEKGYFLFGASTVVILGEKNKWQISHDILNNSKNKRETYIKLGDAIGVKIDK